MIEAFLAGELDEALRTFRALLPSFAYETGDETPNPIPTKAMLRVLGLPAGQCRLPLGEAPAELEERARSVLAALEAFRGQRVRNG
jgi:4-hydroxy-tetrahydrodipicolinate synthase